MNSSLKFNFSLHNTCPNYESISVLKFERLLRKSKVIFEEFLWIKTYGLKLPKKINSIELCLTLCGTRRIRSLNKKFRHKDKSTDVLSFPLFESLRSKKQQNGLWSPTSLGDIIISLPTAKRQAKHFELPLECEIMYLFIHGFLHLLGFDHEKSLKEEKLMEKLEDQIFSQILNTYIKPKKGK
jgi:probable rRNA maturation factor